MLSQLSIKLERPFSEPEDTRKNSRKVTIGCRSFKMGGNYSFDGDAFNLHSRTTEEWLPDN